MRTFPSCGSKSGHGTKGLEGLGSGTTGPQTPCKATNNSSTYLDCLGLPTVLYSTSFNNLHSLFSNPQSLKMHLKNAALTAAAVLSAGAAADFIVITDYPKALETLSPQQVSTPLHIRHERCPIDLTCPRQNLGSQPTCPRSNLTSSNSQPSHPTLQLLHLSFPSYMNS
jgi:hypothetical protein